ncbi:serine protease [Alishewanella sp. 16-MA]|uniref:Serine protease n=1 Tax=Alishewanella maricola TaxID=2795740 RepID=A0ABS8C3E5_9ALTE|nr:serine protease [Alishewanella maricola]MCB5226708.1 serine protease [Alishewanella maricola]
MVIKMHLYRFFLLCILALFSSMSNAQLVDVIKKIKPSVVAIGIYNPTASPRIQLVGTGFVISPGNLVVTNYHVVSRGLDESKMETYVVLSGSVQQVKQHQITSRRLAPEHDLALLSIDSQLPAVTLSSQSELAPEGLEIAFTGYPITSVLGLYPATHRGIIAAHSPIIIPADQASQLHAAALRQLRQPYLIYQLDAVAYPGNSGSPLYNAANGEVIGVINQTYIKASKESVLSDPSGISYAIPAKYIQQLKSN